MLEPLTALIGGFFELMSNVISDAAKKLGFSNRAIERIGEHMHWFFLSAIFITLLIMTIVYT
jgi:hypothetical protein